MEAPKEILPELHVSYSEAKTIRYWDEIWVPRLDHPLNEEVINGIPSFRGHWRKTRAIMVTETGVGFNHISCHLGFCSWPNIRIQAPPSQGIHKSGSPADVSTNEWFPTANFQQVSIESYQK